MTRTEHPYIHLDHAEADLVVGPLKVFLLVVVILGSVFYAGLLVGGKSEFSKGKQAAVNICREDLDTAIREGKEFVYQDGKGLVRYQWRAIYEPSVSF